MSQRRVHLVLGAGGVKCISYAGAVTALLENGFEFATISGSSAGSFIGAILAAKDGAKKFADAASNLDLTTFGGDKSWFSLGTLTPPFAMYGKSLVAERYRETVKSDPKFKDLEIPFATFAIEFQTYRIHLYSSEATPDMPVAEALSAATALPLLFPRQTVGDREMIDGSLVSQSPVWLATAHDDDLPIVLLRPWKDPNRNEPENLPQFLANMMDLSGASRDFYISEQVPQVKVIEINCGELRYDQFDLSPETRKKLVRSGRIAVESELKDLVHAISYPRATTEIESQTRSESAAAKALGSVMNAVPPKRDQVFISYSSKNSAWLHRLQEQLQPYTRNRAFKLWSDSQIRPGADWNKEIGKALASAKVAVLLVTAAYLASEFIKEVELPEFIRASEAKELKLLWVLVEPCGYKATELAKYQAVNDLDSPLESLSEFEQKKELVRICDEINEALNS